MHDDDLTPPTAPRASRLISRRGGIAATAFGLILGGFAGGYVVSHAATTPSPSAAATTPSGSAGSSTGGSSTAPAPGNGAPDGAFHPNENATHEAGESAAREAQENAGQRPTVP